VSEGYKNNGQTSVNVIAVAMLLQCKKAYFNKLQ